MNTCPKCGHREIRGPTYRESDAFGRSECLVYYCITCGYSQTSPTLEQKKFDMMSNVEKLVEKKAEE